MILFVFEILIQSINDFIRSSKEVNSVDFSCSCEYNAFTLTYSFFSLLFLGCFFAEDELTELRGGKFPYVVCVFLSDIKLECIRVDKPLLLGAI